MKSRLIVHALLVPLACSTAVHANKVDIPLKGKIARARCEATPSDGILVSHTKKITNPHNLPSIDPEAKEVYTTFNVSTEKGIGYCVSPEQCYVEQLDIESCKPKISQKAGLFLVRSYNKKTKKEEDSAVTANGIQKIDLRYDYDDTHLPKDPNNTELDKTARAFTAITETSPGAWELKAKGKWYFAKQEESTDYISPEEESKNRMTYGLASVSQNISKNQEAIDHLNARISSINDSITNMRSVTQHRRYSDSKNCSKSEYRIKEKEDEVKQLTMQKDQLLEENSVLALLLKRTAMHHAAAKKQVMLWSKTPLNPTVLNRKKENLKLYRERNSHLQKKEGLKSFENIAPVHKDQADLELAVLALAKQEVQESENKATEYINNHGQIQYHLMGPATLTLEDAFDKVTADLNINNDMKMRMKEKMLTYNSAQSKWINSLENKEEAVKSMQKISSNEQNKANDFAAIKTSLQTARSNINHNSDEWDERLNKRSNIASSIQQSIDHQEIGLATLNNELATEAKQVAVLLKHYQQLGKSEDEAYAEIFDTHFPKQKTATKKTRNDDIDLLKELLTEKEA